MTSPSWPPIQRSSADGSTFSSVSPLVISASRATDIPALFGGWLLQQFTQGYTIRKNPFNGKTQHIALKDTQVIAFWSKNPRPFLHQLNFFNKRGIGYFFQFTLNDYEDEHFEPGLPTVTERISTLQTLSNLIGKDKILWRFDPIIITDTLSPAMVLQKIERIGSAVFNYVNRLTISFLSHYPHVIHRLKNSGSTPLNRTEENISLIGNGLRVLSQQWELPIYTCAEEADLEPFGIHRGSCIDPVYILRTFEHQQKLSAFIANAMPHPLFPSSEMLVQKLKDSGQRRLCRCMISKDIGNYGTCTIGCSYCYAQRGQQT